MATKINGTMMTSDWAPEKTANAVEAELVEVATVPTSPRPITITSSAWSIFIVYSDVRGGYRRYCSVLFMATLTDPDSEVECPVEDEEAVPGPV